MYFMSENKLDVEITYFVIFFKVSSSYVPIIEG